MATGVLPIVVGTATRLAQFYIASDKVYDAVLHFGYSTDSYDRDGAPTSPEVETAVTREQIEPLLERFRGTVAQVPPPVSAKKVAGIPAYKLARKKIDVELKAVEVTFHSIELVEAEGPEARLVVHCSAGTYVRALAHELGQLVGCGAFLTRLTRTRSGDFEIGRARSLEQLEELVGEDRLIEAVLPAAEMLPDIPTEFVDTLTTTFIRQGRDFRVSPFQVRPGSKYVKAVGQHGELIAIGEVRLPNLYHPIMVL
jgi:tRNA pseudouridine55 synthase